MSEARDPGETALLKLSANRRLAHQVLFRHRHPNATPEFHGEIIDDFHGPERNVCTIAFRGSAKSTLAEEGLVIKACYREIQHALIVGASYDKAAERLHAIRRQFEKNDALRTLFGDLRGQPWGDDKIELSTGITLQAMGRGQAIRGTKNEDIRPDFILADDIEDAESVRTPEGREKVQAWFFAELLPSGDEPTLRVRMLANDMHPECLANRLKLPGSGFVVRVYPWEYIDAEGARSATWADRYSLETIDKKKRQLYSLGRGAEYEKEYMCHSESPADKPFKQEMFRTEAQVRTWQAVYAMFDPARTVSRTSATTGYACWSWIANRLVVWDAWAKMLLPDQIITEMFTVDEEFRPVSIGVEEDGLNEFLMQPIRQEQVRRGVTLPVKAMRAPKGKMDFIRGLQPFFNAREIWFAKPLPELQAQLLSFPTGRIDAPNALAYALKMRPGAPIYDDFTSLSVGDALAPAPGRPAWLCLNATPAITTAMLVQLVDGAVRIYADWVREGEPAAILPDIIKEASLAAGRAVQLVAGPHHYDRYTNSGLVQAVRRIPMELRRGVGPELGRPELRALLRRQTRGMPALMCSSGARWTLNGFAGGYCRAMLKQGILADYAEEGVYRTLLEGLESFAGLLALGSPDEDRDDVNYATAANGRRYISARATT